MKNSRDAVDQLVRCTGGVLRCSCTDAVLAVLPGLQSLLPDAEMEESNHQKMDIVGSKHQNIEFWGFPKMVVPQNRWFIRENQNPIKIGDLGVPLF